MGITDTLGVSSFLGSESAGGSVSFVPKSMGSLLSLQFLSYLMYAIVIALAGYLFFKTYFSPYHVNIFEKIGKSGIRWKGRDYGVVFTKDGVTCMKLLFRKKFLPLPLAEFKVMKNKWSVMLNYLQLSDDEFRPMRINIDDGGNFEPMSETEKTWYAQRTKMNLEEIQKSKGLLERHSALFSYAIWGVVGFLIFIMSARYGSGIIADANQKSYQLMSDANSKAASAAGQIASALTSIKIEGRIIPTEVEGKK